ncbi:MAG: DUF3558 domain-containing protein [Pseudonocardia sp.]|uniref:DUF3558 domain-containing protein n=1 Tax=unclassified Pseudonocardia TaxID=2619320 RepID=UPI0008688380|nr:MULTISPECIES: DUF3558 domain-containing protein [unclassified Pseudonocardia]MBN9112710.1 DUF3558 domain-containing protein [Pseudonocardia sp.]ODU19511.1 MAG: hypothetical protein ABS80_19385 [Pseudonocardia sp. SCN 72-51]ODV00103.1 MAG: hypothetical protein ABT15_30295 [Pseudonocardia sp. SCN 73-27]
MRGALAALALIGLALLGGCQVSEEGRASAEPRRDAALVKPTEPEPCGLIGPTQLERLDMEPGKPAVEELLPDASFCRWRAAGMGGDSYMGAVLPDNYLLADVERNYGSSRRTVVTGHPAVIAPVYESLAEETCIVFVEMPDKRLVDMSFWAGRPEGASADLSCSRAIAAAEMVIQTLGSR